MLKVILNIIILHLVKCTSCVDIVKYFLKHPVGVEVSPSSEDRKLLSPGGLCLAVSAVYASCFSLVRKLKPPFLKCEDTSRQVVIQQYGRLIIFRGA